jgi:hypothetical protein
MSALAVLEEAVAKLKWRDEAQNVLTRVRSVDESDMQTLVRVVEDYQGVIKLLRAHANDEENRMLDERYKGLLPSVLKRILERK